MGTFYYSVKGSADEKPNAGVVKADDEDAAIAKLDGVYGNTKENKTVEITILSESEFALLEAERGKQLTHKPE